MSLQMVMFAYGGIEIIGITAGEAKDPEKSIPRAINSVPMRILVFYVGTLVSSLCLSTRGIRLALPVARSC